MWLTTTQQGKGKSTEKVVYHIDTQRKEEEKTRKKNIGVAWVIEGYRYKKKQRKDVGNTRRQQQIEENTRLDHSLHRKNTE